LEAIIKRIRESFLSRGNYFTAFANADSRLEGWFKAETIVLLDMLKQEGLLDNFRCEYSISTSSGRKQIDFGLVFQDKPHLLELKAICISKISTQRGLRFYFHENNVGIIKDFKKLDSITTIPAKQKHVLGFVYPTPDNAKWETMIESLPEDLRHWQCTTRPSDFPEYLFISVWEPYTIDSRG